jgi:cytochrome c oxidase subunit II
VTKFWPWFFIFWPIVAVLLCVMAPSMNWWFPSESGTPLGKQIDDLFYLINVIVTVVFIGTQAALGYVVWKGARHTDEKSWFTHGSHNLEVVWTIVPAGILLFIALYQMDVWAQYRIKGNEAFPDFRSATVAEVTARQFEWRIRYPSPDRRFESEDDVRNWIRNPEPGDLYTVNDLHVPTGRKVLIHLRKIRLLDRPQDHRHSVPDHHAADADGRRGARARGALAVGVSLGAHADLGRLIFATKAGRFRPSSTRCCSRCTPR